MSIEGTIAFEGRDRTRMAPPDVAALGIARTFQNVALFKGMSVLDNIMTGRLLKMRGSFLLEALYWGPARRQELEHRAFVERIIDFLEIPHVRKVPVGRLPYGLQKRVDLGRALAAEPRVLLLDEPMAGMNVEEKQDMSRFILDVNDEFGTTIVLIEHDMGVVMDISDRVVVLDYGRKIGDGAPDEVRGYFDGTALEVLERVMRVNFFGTLYCTHAALPHIKQRRGSLIAVSSLAGSSLRSSSDRQARPAAIGEATMALTPRCACRMTVSMLRSGDGSAAIEKCRS